MVRRWWCSRALGALALAAPLLWTPGSATAVPANGPAATTPATVVSTLDLSRLPRATPGDLRTEVTDPGVGAVDRPRRDTAATRAAQGPPAAPASEVRTRRSPLLSRDLSGAREETVADPLAISIEELTPAVMPTRGPITISGTITNNDLETWREIYLYPYLNTDGCRASGACPPPMLTADELIEAAASDPVGQVGERIVELDVRDGVAELGPGESTSYSLTVPQRVLRAELADPDPGIYWFGVHALGASDSSPRDDLADGRARTFLPALPTGRQAPGGSVDTAVVVPLRAPIDHAPNGALAGVGRWQRWLSLDGALGRMLAFGDSAADRPVSWLIDPAVVDAVARLADGNPARTLVDPVPPEPDPTETPGSGTDSTDSPPDGDDREDGGGSGAAGRSGTRADPNADDPTPSGLPTDGEGDSSEGDSSESGDDGTTPSTTAARSARPWLLQARRLLSSDDVLALPYGDPDLAAAGTGSAELTIQARARTSAVLEEWELATTAALAGPRGVTEPDVLAEAGEAAGDADAAEDPEQAIALLSDVMFGSEEFPEGAPATGTIGSMPVVVTSANAAAGGPGPNDRLSPVALRQRLLSEAALRLLADPEDPRPIVLQVPTGLSPAGAADFWSGLDQDWINLTGVRSLAAELTEEIDPADLTAAEPADPAPVARSIFDEADRLLDAGTTLQNVLGEAATVADEVAREALSGVSYAQRGDASAGIRLARSREWIDRRLRSVRLSAPPGVTLSSASGRFSVTVSNDLDVPVTVLVTAAEHDAASVAPSEPIVLGPNSRTSVSLEARTSRAGVHNVQLMLTDPAGNPLGSTQTVPVRSGQVSVVIWGIIGSGVAILFVAIGIRLARRLRGRAPSDAESGERPDPTTVSTIDATTIDATTTEATTTDATTTDATTTDATTTDATVPDPRQPGGPGAS